MVGVGDVPGDGDDPVAQSAVASRRVAGSRPSVTTFQPRAASARTRARPSPRDPPVTMAVRCVCSTMAPLGCVQRTINNSDHCF